MLLPTSRSPAALNQAIFKGAAGSSLFKLERPKRKTDATKSQVFSVDKPDYWADRKLSGRNDKNTSSLIQHMSDPIVPKKISQERLNRMAFNNRTTYNDEPTQPN